MRVLLSLGLMFLVAVMLAGPWLGGASSTTHAARLPDQATPTATSSPTATTTPSVALTATASPSPTSTATLTATPTGTTAPAAGRVYLPLIWRHAYAPPPTPTATPVPTGAAPTFVRNGDFEAGSEDWTELSQQGFQLILEEDDFPEGVAAHSGNWAAWLGGADNEQASVVQDVTVPAERPNISYWIWVASEDLCGYDIGGLGLGYGEDEFEALDGYWLCQDNNTDGWVNHTVSAADFVGQQVELWILADTDGSQNSNLFVDDVAFVSDGAAATSGGPYNVGVAAEGFDRLADLAHRVRSLPPNQRHLRR